MSKPTILLHSCCGPCSTAVIERLSGDYDITILYYNPNIYPEKEYLKRKSEQLKFIEKFNGSNENEQIKFLDHDYDSQSFYKATKGLENEREGGARCAVCFKLRLSETAKLANKKGFDYFGTTLTVSPHKNAELINSIGQAIEKETNVKFLVSNFKKNNGYKRSVELAKEYDLYRQNYCGCEFALKIQQQEAPDSLKKTY